MTPLDERLQSLVAAGDRPRGRPARDPVNAPMIRHWCDAIGDRNPVYTDAEAAAASIHEGLVAPPTMLQAWNMPGLREGDALSGETPFLRAITMLREAGYTSVVATDSEQEYARYLRLGDTLTPEDGLESISEEKRTAMGVGYFVTTLTRYHDQNGELVGTMRFRTLWFRPPQAD